jgi:hypothetical protein
VPEAVEEVPVVRPRTFITPAPFQGPWGDVCPETARIGVATRHLRKIVISMSAGVGVPGAQDGPEAFAAERGEVPT